MVKEPLIFVYTDDPMCSMSSSDAICEVLNKIGKYKVWMCGPDSYPKISLKLALQKADCVVFPGGGGDSDQFYNTLKFYKKDVQKFIENGGKYLGICMGSYFAEKYYFELLPHNIGCSQYIKRPNSNVTKHTATTTTIKWKDEWREMYFHDGSAFYFIDCEPVSTIIYATYNNGDIAALIQPYGKGKIGLIGPHPEAPKWWFYVQPKLRENWYTCINHDLLNEFMDKLLQ
jgi:imidazoleglycerol phosphate synthase glutamine amidotransferase subunit HisH